MIMCWDSVVVFQVNGGAVKDELCEDSWSVGFEDLAAWLDFGDNVDKFWI